MKNKYLKLILLFIPVLIMLSQPCPHHVLPKDGELDPETAHKFKTIRKMRLIEELNLTEEQTESFMVVFNRFNKENEKIFTERRTLMDTIEELTGLNIPPNEKDMRLPKGFSRKMADEDELKDLLKKAKELREREKINEELFIKETEAILDPLQQLTLITFEPRFQKDMRQMLKSFMKDDKRPR